jgi:hypothetical protein
MDEATARLLQMIRDALKPFGGREVAAVRTACLVASVQEDGREACLWLSGYLAVPSVGTGALARDEEKRPGDVGTPAPTQTAAS